MKKLKFKELNSKNYKQVYNQCYFLILQEAQKNNAKIKQTQLNRTQISKKQYFKALEVSLHGINGTVNSGRVETSNYFRIT